MTDAIEPRAAAVDDVLGESTPGRGGPPRWDEADAYFWAEGCDDEGAREYHWHADCPWLATSLARHGRLVRSRRPPANAIEREEDRIAPAERSTFWAAASERVDVRWLCSMCSAFMPRAVATERDPADACCLTCGCAARFHEGASVGVFNTGCWFVVDEYPWDEAVSLVHCRCDGYRSEPHRGRRPRSPDARVRSVGA